MAELRKLIVEGTNVQLWVDALESRMLDFASEIVRSWDQFHEIVLGLGQQGPSSVRQWLYRDQTDDKCLRTTIERALVGWGIPLNFASSIELQTIRGFGARRIWRRAKPPFRRTVARYV